jgi:hypothetical protein
MDGVRIKIPRHPFQDMPTDPEGLALLADEHGPLIPLATESEIKVLWALAKLAGEAARDLEPVATKVADRIAKRLVVTKWTEQLEGGSDIVHQ